MPLAALTVLVCPTGDGCPVERAVFAEHAAFNGLAWTDLPGLVDTTVLTRHAAWVAALDALEADPTPARAEAAHHALAALPAVVPAAELARLFHAEARAHAGDPPAAVRALVRAASVSGGVLVDLPPTLPPGIVAQALDQAAARRDGPTGTLAVRGEGTVWVDGHALGPAPVRVDLVPGWHRVAAGPPGAPRLAVHTVTLQAGRTLALAVDPVATPSAAELEGAVLAVINGQPAPDGAAAALSSAARDAGWRTVRMVRIAPFSGTAQPGSDLFEDTTGRTWVVRSAWLDARARAFRAPSGPRLARAAASPERLRASVAVGYTRLGPRDHLGLDLAVGLPLTPWLTTQLGLGVMRANDPYWLYEDWVDPHLFPVRLGLQAMPRWGGPFGRLQAVAAVPYTLGGTVAGGWEQGLTAHLRLAAEGEVGWTGQGVLAGAGLRVVTRR